MVFPDVTLQLYQMHACLDRFESSGVPWLHCCGRALIDLRCFSHPLGDRSRGRNHCWCTISKSFLGNWGIGAQQLYDPSEKGWSTGISAARRHGRWAMPRYSPRSYKIWMPEWGCDHQRLLRTQTV